MKFRSPLFKFLVLLISFALLAQACSSTVTVDSDSGTEADTASETPSEEAKETDSGAGSSEPEPSATAEAEPAATSEPEPSATAEPEPTETPEVEETTTESKEEQLDWEPCPISPHRQCAKLTVPIEYEDPSLGELELSVAISRATVPEKRIGYLFLNPGGPGGSAVEFVEYLEYLGFPDEIVERFDIVGLDPRGVAESEPEFACGTGTEQFDLLSQLGEFVEKPEEIEIGFKAIELCKESMGPVASRLGTDYLAQDMELLREKLGGEKISFLGLSYGSTVGAWYATKFPDSVRAMVLDGAGDPTLHIRDLETGIELVDMHVSPFESQLGEALDACDSEECPIYNNGDPRQYWIDTSEKFQLVKEAGYNDNSSVYLAIYGFLYTESTWPELWDALHALREEDDPSLFIESISRAGTAQGEVSFTGHVNCLDSWTLFSDITTKGELALEIELDEPLDEHVEKNYPLYAAIDIDGQQSECNYFEVLDARPLEQPLNGSGTQILVVGNTTDPITPFIQSERFANDVLDNGVLVRVPHSSHVVFPGNPCVNDIVQEVLVNEKYPESGTECSAHFADKSFENVDLEVVELVDGAVSVQPSDWTEIAPGVTLQPEDDTGATAVLMIPLPPGSSDPVEAAETLMDQTVEALKVDTFESEAGTWVIYDLHDEENDTIFRFGVLDGLPYIVGGQTHSEAIDSMTEHIIHPILAAFVPANG